MSIYQRGYWFQSDNVNTGYQGIHTCGTVLGANGNVQSVWQSKNHQIWKAKGGNAWSSIGHQSYVETIYMLMRVDTAEHMDTNGYIKAGYEHATLVQEVRPGKKWKAAVTALIQAAS